MKLIGTRAEVFHCTADHKAAMDRMKKEGNGHLVKVFKPEKGEFKLQPKQGTAKHKKLIKKMK